MVHAINIWITKMRKILILLVILSTLAQPITFDESYSEFLNYNLAIQQYLAKKDQAKLRVSQSMGRAFPQLYATIQRDHNDLNGSRQASATSELEETLLNYNPTNARRAKFTLSQVLFDMSLFDEISLRNMAVHQSNLETIQVIQESSIQFATVFYSIAKNQYLKRSLNQRKEMYETVIKDLDSKQLLKLMTFEDTYAIRSDQLKTIEESLTVNKDLHLGILDYHHMLDISPINHELKLDVPKVDLEEIDEFNAIDGITFAYNNRADLMLLNHQIDILIKERDSKLTLFKPKANLTTSYGMTNEDSFKFKTNNDRDFSWSIDVTTPLFDGYSSNAIGEEYDAAIDEIYLQIAQLKNTIRRDITDALFDINIAKETYLNNIKRTKFQRERLRLIKIKRDVNQAVDADVSIIRSDYKQAEVNERIASILLIEKIVT